MRQSQTKYSRRAEPLENLTIIEAVLAHEECADAAEMLAAVNHIVTGIANKVTLVEHHMELAMVEAREGRDCSR